MSQTAPPDRDVSSGGDDREADATPQPAGKDWKQAVSAVTSTVADAAVDAVAIVGDAARTLTSRTRGDATGDRPSDTDAERGTGTAATTERSGANGVAQGNGATAPTSAAPRPPAAANGASTTVAEPPGPPGVTEPPAKPTVAEPAFAEPETRGDGVDGSHDRTVTAPRPSTTTTGRDARTPTDRGNGAARPPDIAGEPVAPPRPAVAATSAQPAHDRAAPTWRQRTRRDTREPAWLPALRRRREHDRPWLVRAGLFAATTLAGLVVIAVAAIALVPRALAYAGDSADAELILPGDTAFDPLAQRTRVLYANGSLLAILHGEEDRNPVRLEKMPDHAWQAIVAAEDKKFFEHDGYDPAGIGRALLENVRGGGVEQGGSTISQQVARMNFKEVGLEKSVSRKLKEVAYAIALEKRFTKEEILDRYVNQVYFGAGAYGLQAASEEFFDKNVVQIRPDEAALLAGLISSPSAYNPRVNPGLAKQQRDLVLRSMAEAGYLSNTEAAEYMRRPLKIAKPSKGTNKQPSIVEEIMREFNANPLFGATLQEREDNLFNGGLRIRTTIRPKLQKLAQKTVEAYFSNEGPTAAIGVVDPRSGAIKAAASSKKYNKDNFNLALRGRRQPGSAFKPFVMAEALRQGFSPSTTLDARSPIVIPQGSGPPWSVENYGGASYGQLDMASATKQSVNTYFAQLIELVGVQKTVHLAEKMGIPTETAIGGPGEYGPAIVLGGLRRGVTPIEMASAYSTFANNGVHIEPYLIAEVKRGGKDLLNRQPQKVQVLRPEVNAAALRILEGPPSPGGTAPNAAIPPWPLAGKTGTTQLATDAWFVGTTPVLSTAVWVGYPKGQVRMYGATGGGTAAPVWHSFMYSALSGREPKSFPSVDEAEFVGKTVNVPNVVGLSEQGALSKLAKRKLIGRAQYQSSQAPAGSVIWASPSDSAQVGTTVYVGVSTGPPPPEPKPDKPNNKPKPKPKPRNGGGGNGGGGNGGRGGGGGD